MKYIFANWKTTVCGALALVAALPTMGVALPAWAVTAAAIATGLGHVLARDGNVTSEQSRAPGVKGK